MAHVRTRATKVDRADTDMERSADLQDGAGEKRSKAADRPAGAKQKKRSDGRAVFTITMSDEAFGMCVRAIYVQSLTTRKVTSMREAAVTGMRAIAEMDRARIMEVLDRHVPGWHRGENRYYIQLSPDEAELVKDTRKIIARLDPARQPRTLAETLALAFSAGTEADVVRAILATSADAAWRSGTDAKARAGSARNALGSGPIEGFPAGG